MLLYYSANVMLYEDYSVACCAQLTDILPNPETLATDPSSTASSCAGRVTNPILGDGVNGVKT